MNTHITPSTLAQEVVDLVSLPEIYLKLRELLNDRDFSLTEIADVISVDPSLVSRILRIANSALYGFASQVDNIPRAVSLLGAQQIHDFVLATSVAQSFAGIPSELLDMREFWRSSILCGAAANIFADKRGFLDSEHMFTIGLLAHVGRLVLYLRLPIQIVEALSAASRDGTRLSRELESRLGFNDADVAGALLSAWKLPESLIEPVENRAHPSPQRIEPYFERACIVHVASAIADREDCLSELEGMVSSIDDAAWQYLELNLESVRELITAAKSLADDIAEKFLPEPA